VAKVVFDESVTQDARDFRTELSKLRQTNADVIFYAAVSSKRCAALKQIKDTGLKLPIIGGDIWDADEVITSPGAEGVMYTVGKMDNSDSLEQKQKARPEKRLTRFPQQWNTMRSWLLLRQLQRPVLQTGLLLGTL